MSIKGGLHAWECTGALKHHCPSPNCHTPLHDPRSTTTCVGIHVEPCHKFHTGLHQIHSSHECFACLNCKEAHTKRHLNIAEAINDLSILDAENGQPQTLRWKPSFNKDALESSLATSVESSTSSEAGDNPPILKKKDKKQARKCASYGRRFSDINVCTANISFIDECLHPSIQDETGIDGTPYNDRELRMIQAGFNPILIAENIGFTASARNRVLCKYKGDLKSKLRHDREQSEQQGKRIKSSKPVTAIGFSSFGKPQARPASDDHSLSETEIDLFQRLNVKVVTTDKSKKRRALVIKIIRLVREDVCKIAVEVKEKEIREAAFWRWATKDSLNNMMLAHAERDWQTGEKIISMGH